MSTRPTRVRRSWKISSSPLIVHSSTYTRKPQPVQLQCWAVGLDLLACRLRFTAYPSVSPSPRTGNEASDPITQSLRTQLAGGGGGGNLWRVPMLCPQEHTMGLGINMLRFNKMLTRFYFCMLHSVSKLGTLLRFQSGGALLARRGPTWCHVGWQCSPGFLVDALRGF